MTKEKEVHKDELLQGIISGATDAEDWMICFRGVIQVSSDARRGGLCKEESSVVVWM